MRSERRVDRPKLDVRKHDISIRMGPLHRCRKPSLGFTTTTGDSGLRRVGVGGEVAIEPVHRHSRVIPNRQDEDHLGQGLAHRRIAPEGGKVVVVIQEKRFLLLAEVVIDVVDGIDAVKIGYAC